MQRILFLLIAICSFSPMWAQEAQRATIKDATKAPLDTTNISLANNWLRYGHTNDLFPLHEGLNGTLSLSAIMGLGHHTPKGVGFGRSLDFTYASPLSKQLSYTLSANTIQTDWGGFHDHSVGIGGSLSYLLSDRCSISLEGYKNVVNPAATREIYPYLRCNHFVEGAFNFKCTDNVFIQISVGSSSWSH